MSDTSSQQMQQQAEPARQMGEAQTAFEETQPEPRQPAHLKVGDENYTAPTTEEPKAEESSQPETKDLTKEEEIAQRILNAKNPVVVVTENMADSYGSMSKYMFDTFDGIPVVMQNAAAAKKFRTARYNIDPRNDTQIIGHFTEAGGHEIGNRSQIDVAIVIGQANGKIRETFPNATFFENKTGQIQNRVNFAVINQMREKRKTPV